VKTYRVQLAPRVTDNDKRERRVQSGPLGSWLIALRERLGDEVFEQLGALPAGEADGLLRALGVVEFRHSLHYIRHVEQIRRTGTPPVQWGRDVGDP